MKMYVVGGGPQLLLVENKAQPQYIAELENITKASPYNEHPLTPHFYIVKLGFTGVYIFFALKHRLWVLVRTASINVLSKNKKNIKNFHLKIDIFTVVKYCCILHGACLLNETMGCKVPTRRAANRLSTRELVERLEGLSVHMKSRYVEPSLHINLDYDNTPMQYTAIFQGCKNVHFQIFFFKLFSYFCSKHLLWVHVRTASVRRF